MSDKESLIRTVQRDLKGYKFIIASNREPYINSYKGNKIEFIKTVSGLTIALDPVIQTAGGTWIAWGSGDGDKEAVDLNNSVKVPPENPKYTLRRIWLSHKEEEGYYNGYANQALWPLSHIAYEKPLFLENHWKVYKEVNKKFAEAILEEIGDKKAFVWLQDYHLTLAARYIKEKRPDAVVALFWHIPWPNPEAFRVCPQKKEILEGLLSCDFLGFHIKYHCINFMHTVDAELEAKVNFEESNVTYNGHKTLVRDFPISVDFEGISKESQGQKVIELIKDLRSEIPCSYEILTLGIDRIDYTKGILERFNAVDVLLEKYPEYKKRFLLYQIGVPSRTRIKTYSSLLKDIRKLADKINKKYKIGQWCPIALSIGTLDYLKQLAFYRSADMCIVSSLHDGMNLVAKEYVAANVDNKGVLLLSKFTGSAREFAKGAILINPYDFESTADAIKEAIEIPKDARRENMRNLRSTLARRNIYAWAENFISSLELQSLYIVNNNQGGRA